MTESTDNRGMTNYDSPHSCVDLQGAVKFWFMAPITFGNHVLCVLKYGNSHFLSLQTLFM